MWPSGPARQTEREDKKSGRRQNTMHAGQLDQSPFPFLQKHSTVLQPAEFVTAKLCNLKCQCLSYACVRACAIYMSFNISVSIRLNVCGCVCVCAHRK